MGFLNSVFGIKGPINMNNSPGPAIVPFNPSLGIPATMLPPVPSFHSVAGQMSSGDHVPQVLSAVGVPPMGSPHYQLRESGNASLRGIF